MAAVFVDLHGEVNKYKQNPTQCSSALWRSCRAVGHTEKILLTGHCSMAWFDIEKNSQAQRQCCHYAELGIAGLCILCISSLEQMEKGHSLSLLNPRSFEVLFTSWKLPARPGPSLALLCLCQRYFWDQKGSIVLKEHQTVLTFPLQSVAVRQCGEDTVRAICHRC